MVNTRKIVRSGGRGARPSPQGQGPELENAAVVSPSLNDRSLRERISKTLETDLGITAAVINVVVADGVVGLWGTVRSGEQKRAILIAVERTAGSAEIRDHIYVPPGSTESVLWTE